MLDIFGQTHPTVANEIFACMNCNRSIVAGKFAPHLEKCMGKVILFSFELNMVNIFSILSPYYYEILLEVYINWCIRIKL